MNNEEKAKRTYPYFEDMNDIEIVQTNAKRLGFIAGCEWKDEQLEAEKEALINKACEWMEYHLSFDVLMFDEGVSVDTIVSDFKQAMKGE